MAQSVGQTRGASLTGRITGTDNAGQVSVRTDTVELRLASPRPLPTGGNLLLQIVGSSGQSSDTSAGPQTLTGAQRWETLHEFLRASDLATIRTVVEHAIPQPGSRFTGTLLFFLSALRAGDLRGWLGASGTRLVEREGLLRRMSDEFGSMQRLANEPAGQDWRLFLIPVLSDAQLHQMRLFVRDHRGAKENDDDSQETRFVIEVTFSKLGPFQFDGLTQDKTLNLILRTQRDIGNSMHQSIVEIFDSTIAALGFTGSVRFRTEAFFEVQPLRDANLPRDASVTV